MCRIVQTPLKNESPVRPSPAVCPGPWRLSTAAPPDQVRVGAGRRGNGLRPLVGRRATRRHHPFRRPAHRRLHRLRPRPGLQGRRRGTADRDRLALARRTGVAKIGHQAFCRKILPATFTARMAWDSYRLADACIANTAWEAHLMNYLFGAPRERVHVVPNGVEEIFLNSAPAVARALARLHRHHHGTQTRAGTGRGRRPRANAALDHWQGLRRLRPLRAKIFCAGETAAANPPPRGRHCRPRAAGADLPRGARVCFVERHGNPEPFGGRGRRVRMPAAVERFAVGAQHLWRARQLLSHRRAGARRRDSCGNFTTRPRR